MILYISDLLIPLIFVIVISYAWLKKVSIFDTFIDGVKDGVTTVIDVFPTIIGLLVAVGILRASGFLDIISDVLKPITNTIGFPTEVIPITLMRLVSASAARGLLLDIFANYGPDSFIGRLSSIIMSSTETIFYTMSVYFMSVKITKTKYTLAGALIANFIGVIAAFFITLYTFGI
ncbi:MAG: spore maturation protein [Defluviitaleaceae bacterium]|nr:spore maturation protein [Defluviitaleaceae bacterium]